MKIGIDAKWYFRGPPSGRRVVRSLVKHLMPLAGEDEIHLFTDRDYRDERLDVDIDPRRRHHVWAGNNQLSNVAVLPRVAQRLCLDAVVYQNFVPRRAAHARIAFVHDAIFDAHPEYFTRLERVYFAPLRYLARSADRVCTVSHAERERLIALGYAHADRADVVPNAVDDVFLGEPPAPQDVRGILAAFGIKQPFILYVGRVTARKNVGALVRALPLIAGEPVSLVIAGPADDTAGDFTVAMRESEHRDRIHSLGAVGDEGLRALYASAAAFCFPSFDESFGLPPIEAMALGAPCVVSDIPALREVCGSAAVYVDPRSPSAIAAALTEVLAHPERTEWRVHDGHARAATFRWEHSARALLSCVHAAERTRA